MMTIPTAQPAPPTPDAPLPGAPAPPQTLSVSFEAMALDMPTVAGHPNRMPFSGVLTKVDQFSDEPPGGAEGKRTFMSAIVAEAALPSLLGMAVSFTKNFDGHDSQRKIGLITGAEVVGDEVQIQGYFYAKDFPDDTARIKREKGAMGFSFEADASVLPGAAATDLTIESCVFTGAAVLYKHLAAYQTTSLAASAEQIFKEQDMDELKQILAGMATLTEGMAAMQGEIAGIKAAASLGGPIIEQVKPHVDALNAAAEAMDRAGVGADRNSGHVGAIRKIAAHMAAAAVSGNVPSVFTDHDYLPSARIEAGAAADAVAKDKEIADLKASMADMGTKLADMSTKQFNASAQPARATLTPEIKILLAKASIGEDAMKDGKMSTEQVDTMLAASGVVGIKAIETKLKLRAAGLMPAGKAA